jgi:ribosome modulation factor
MNGQRYHSQQKIEINMIIHEKTLALLMAVQDRLFKKPNTLDDFTAKLYSYELTIFKNQGSEENLNTILLEYAIALYPKCSLWAAIPHFILDEINKDGIKTTFKDRAILHAVYNATGRHNMDYYSGMGEQFVVRFALEIAEFTRLKEMEMVYLKSDEQFRSAFLSARKGYLRRLPGEKPLTRDDCPYSEEDLREAWLNGYGLSCLDKILFNHLQQI